MSRQSMKTPLETFKGIEFVRISSLPKDQQLKIWETFQQDKIIKIVKDKALMNDCILFRDFASWQENESTQPAPSSHPLPLPSPIRKLAFK